MNKLILIIFYTTFILPEYCLAMDKDISTVSEVKENNHNSEKCVNNNSDCPPRVKNISSSINEHKYAAYMDAWRVKVEKIGRINYPPEARERKLYGTLILDVGINPDGSLNSITIKKASNHKILDDAAIRAVRLASPFPPFPESIRNEVDILHITEKWIYKQ